MLTRLQWALTHVAACPSPLQATALRICGVGRPVGDFGGLLRLVAEQDQKMCDKDEDGCGTAQVGSWHLCELPQAWHHCRHSSRARAQR
jgi:hypothetical protein